MACKAPILPGGDILLDLVGVIKKQVFPPFGAGIGGALQSQSLESVIKRARIGEQRHARLLRGPVSFAVVAVLAGRDQVFGEGAAPARSRQDVIEGQVEDGSLQTAVLAAVMVAREYAMAIGDAILSRPDIDVMGQADNRRNVEDEPGRPQNVAFVQFQDLGHLPPDQRQRLWSRHNTERLIRGIQ